jgi:hypothetical protein
MGQNTHSSRLTPRWTTCVASKLQTIRVNQEVWMMYYLHFLFCLHRLLTTRAIIITDRITLFWFWPSKFWILWQQNEYGYSTWWMYTMSNKNQAACNFYAPLQLQSQFKTVSFPIFVNAWSLSSIHYNQSCCIHVNQRHQHICRKPCLSYLPETVIVGLRRVRLSRINGFRYHQLWWRTLSQQPSLAAQPQKISELYFMF